MTLTLDRLEIIDAFNTLAKGRNGVRVDKGKLTTHNSLWNLVARLFSLFKVSEQATNFVAVILARANQNREVLQGLSEETLQLAMLNAKRILQLNNSNSSQLVEAYAFINTYEASPKEEINPSSIDIAEEADPKVDREMLIDALLNNIRTQRDTFTIFGRRKRPLMINGKSISRKPCDKELEAIKQALLAVDSRTFKKHKENIEDNVAEYLRLQVEGVIMHPIAQDIYNFIRDDDIDLWKRIEEEQRNAFKKLEAKRKYERTKNRKFKKIKNILKRAGFEDAHFCSRLFTVDAFNHFCDPEFNVLDKKKFAKYMLGEYEPILEEFFATLDPKDFRRTRFSTIMQGKTLLTARDENTFINIAERFKESKKDKLAKKKLARHKLGHYLSTLEVFFKTLDPKDFRRTRFSEIMRGQVSLTAEDENTFISIAKRSKEFEESDLESDLIGLSSVAKKAMRQSIIVEGEADRRQSIFDTTGKKIDIRLAKHQIEKMKKLEKRTKEKFLRVIKLLEKQGFNQPYPAMLTGIREAIKNQAKYGSLKYDVTPLTFNAVIIDLLPISEEEKELLKDRGEYLTATEVIRYLPKT